MDSLLRRKFHLPTSMISTRAVRTWALCPGPWRSTNCIRPRFKHTRHGKEELSIEEESKEFASRNRLLFESRKDHQIYPLIGDVRAGGTKLRICDFRNQFDQGAMEQNPLLSQPYTVQGRVRKIRHVSKGLVFMDLYQDQLKLQVVLNYKRMVSALGKSDLSLDDFEKYYSLLRRGDHISVTGFPFRTQSGELSVLVDRQIDLLSPALHPVPTNYTNDTNRSHNRVVDLLANPDSRSIVMARSTIMSSIRSFFTDRQFLEVQTPILSSHAGGALARPFVTHSNALDSGGKSMELSLRIAPELWLKRLIIAGFDRVFEIGQCFRNEGIDATHNPEFTSCEFYRSHTDLNQLMDITQELLRYVISQVWQRHPEFESNLDQFREYFVPGGKPFNTIDFVPYIESKTGIALPENLDQLDALTEYCSKVGVSPGEEGVEMTPSRVMDKLCGVFIEPDCIDPTFIMNHPHFMAPLAKSTVITDGNGIERELSRRCELFINGKEYVNAYEEENSPNRQRLNFAKQSPATVRDEEEPLLDDSYAEALEWGLPPTGGWGMGIDRLVMLITGAKRIERVLTFGGVKTVNYQ
uniref:Lysine--tRNA ligase n=1 Tax=Blastobotrys adeninivorans TaxID=409370 RepID=A0A060TA79_BLAAD